MPKIDQATLEAIVREVVQRLLASRPDLFQAVAEDDAPGGNPGEHGPFEHYSRVLSESDLIACRKQGKRSIRCDPKTIITPLARERARDLGIRIVDR